MIPVLYETTETAFTSNGIGRLVDAISCIVTEERNGPYELEMQYPITGRYFSELTHSRIIYAVPSDGTSAQPFRIYRISKPLDGICTIYAEHISYELNHIPVMPFTASSCAAALAGLKTHSGQTNPFSVWTDKSVVGNYTVTEPRSFRDLLGGSSGSILDVYGKGEYEFDKWAVKLYVNRGVNSGVVIRYAKNLTELVNDENIETVYTGVCPFWKDNQTGTLVTLPEVAVWADTAANYPYKRTKIIDASDQFQSTPTVAQLRQWATNYITNNDIGIPKVNIDFSFVPLSQTYGASVGYPLAVLVLPSATVNGDTVEGVDGSVDGDTLYLDGARWALTTEDYRTLERIHLCDTISVVYDALGVSATAKVIKTFYDVLRDRYESLEVGDARTSLATQIVDIETSIKEQTVDLDISDELREYVDHQTALLTGGLGGYVVMHSSTGGEEPDEILIMDTDDTDTATNIIRMNRNGIGFSSSGYSGPYVSAWTIDGVFNTAFIGAGSITGNQIRAGSITAGNLSLYGKMGVYTDATLGTNGGYIGYMAGATASGTTTNGIAIMDSASQNYVMATSAGVKMFNGSSSTAAEFNISGGFGEFVGSGVYVQGDVRLNATNSGGVVTYGGVTTCNALSAQVYVATRFTRMGNSTYGGDFRIYNSSLQDRLVAQVTNTGVAMWMYSSANAVAFIGPDGYGDMVLTLTTSGGSSASLTYALIQKLINL